jgi:hypothetical protein
MRACFAMLLQSGMRQADPQQRPFRDILARAAARA